MRHSTTIISLTMMCIMASNASAQSVTAEERRLMKASLSGNTDQELEDGCSGRTQIPGGDLGRKLFQEDSCALLNERRRAAATGSIPTATDILKIAAKSHAKYSETGSLTSTPGEVAFASPFGGTGYYYRRAVSNVRCTKLSVVKFQCSYDRAGQYVPASDSLWGAMAVVALNGTYGGTEHFTETFIKGKGGWTSPTIEKSA